MSRSYSFDLATVLSIGVLYTIIRRDEVEVRLTSWSNAITIGSETWEPAVGLKAYDISDRNDGTPSSTQVEFSCTADGPITLQDVADKLYESAEVFINLCDADNPTAKNFHFYGRVGSVSKPLHGQVLFDLQNPHGFPCANLVPTFTVMCRYAFGDFLCSIPVMRGDILRDSLAQLGTTGRYNSGTSPTGYGNRYFECTTPGIMASVMPTVDYTIGNSTTDGASVWIAHNAWERACEIGTIVDRHNIKLTGSPDVRAVDNWYNPGKIMFVTGKNKNKVFKIAGWRASDNQLTTLLPAGNLTAVGDTAFIWPDCDKTLIMCQGKYANAQKYGGFPYYEGARAAKQDI